MCIGACLLSSFGFENCAAVVSKKKSAAVNSSALAEPEGEKAACGGVTVTGTKASTLRITDFVSLTLTSDCDLELNEEKKRREAFKKRRGKTRAFLKYTSFE